MAKFILEFFPNVQAVHVIVEKPKSEKIAFKPFQIVIDGTRYSWEGTPLPELIPSSITNLKYNNGEGLHVRFKTKGLRKEGIIHQTNGCNPSSNIKISCRFCKGQLLDHSFVRTLPLPSQDWHDISGDVFCHNHGHRGVPLNLSPKHDDLLFSDKEILVHRELLSKSATKISLNSVKVVCQRCSSVIGHIKESRGTFTDCTNEANNTVTLSLFKVYVRKEQQVVAIGGDCNIQNWVAIKLLRLSRELQCFLFIIKSTEGQNLVQIQCLRSVGWLLSNCCSKSISYIFSGSNDQCSQPKLILKVLFKLLTATDDIGSSCLSMESIVLPVEQSLQLCVSLMDNHMSLPPSLRTAAGNMKVGYLELDINDFPYKEI